MALPELDTSEISWIAYWNFLDAGALDISPTEAISAMETYEEYSNGVDGTIHLNRNSKQDRLANCRVKDDGWIICWIDRTDTFQTKSVDQEILIGQYDWLNDWTQQRQNPDIHQNSLERSIQTLQNQFSNTGDAAYSPSDVALYNYAYPNATTLTLVADNVDDNNGSFETTVVSGTTLHRYAVAACTGGGTVVHDATDQAIEVANGSYRLGTLDALAEGTVSAGKTLTTNLNTNSNNDRPTVAESILWS